jgi:hypothetical protein
VLTKATGSVTASIGTTRGLLSTVVPSTTSKWYTEAQEWFDEYKELGDEAGISVEFMRVGEEPADVEHLHNEACDETGGCMLYTETTIRVSGRD